MTDRTKSILDAMSSPSLFWPWFDGDSWGAWRSFLSALFHLPMSQAQAEVYRACTGRKTLPAASFSEAWLIVGRRGGKSLILALCAVFLALFKDWRSMMVPGERGVVMVIAQNKLQARVIFSYIKAFLLETPALARYVESVTTERIDLVDGISVEVHPCSYRSIRGRTVICALCDELAVWDTEDAAEPDTEVLNALRPALGSVRGSVLLCASSSYARRGELWRAYQEHFGNDGDEVLCWKAPTVVMNPTYPQKVIESAFKRDPSRAAAEYLSEFRSDAESHVSREIIESLVVKGVYERAPMEGVSYLGFTDPSGGAQDAFTLAISHHEDGKAILDAIRCRRPPFSPEAVCEDFSKLLRLYGIFSVEGDRYAGSWPAEGFGKFGITYRQCSQTKSELYQELLPALNSGQAVLLDQPHLVDKLCGLERRTARGGRDSIDHVRSSHDDMANAVAGALLPALRLPFDPQPDDFAVIGAPIASQLRELAAEGYRGDELRMMVDRPETPWSTTSRRPSRVFAWGVASE